MFQKCSKQFVVNSKRPNWYKTTSNWFMNSWLPCFQIDSLVRFVLDNATISIVWKYDCWNRSVLKSTHLFRAINLFVSTFLVSFSLIEKNFIAPLSSVILFNYWVPLVIIRILTKSLIVYFTSSSFNRVGFGINIRKRKLWVRSVRKHMV